MNDSYYKRLNAELAFEFHLFSLEHGRWMSENVPLGAVVIMQTDNEEFNRWAIETARRNRAKQTPPPTMVLVHIRKLRQRRSRIVTAEAELLRTRKRA